MPTDLLIYIVIAAVLVIWLRNTLGTRHGEEHDRSDILEQLRQRQQQQKNTNTSSEHKIDIPARSTHSTDQSTSAHQLNDVKIEGGAETANEIVELMKQDSHFDPKSFVNGAREAFPMIVEAFAKGDLKTLKFLCSSGVYTTFEQAIEDRSTKGEILTTDVHAVRECTIMGVKHIEGLTYIKLRFIAEEGICVRDRQGNVISGHPDKIYTMNDVWTFGRDMHSKDPTWYLYETSDDVVDELKNPVPDSR